MKTSEAINSLQQKSDLRKIIYRKIKKCIEENPEQASGIALDAVTRLSAKMTLEELQDWNFALHLPEWKAQAKNLTPESE